jgi:hypothetical protein
MPKGLSITLSSAVVVLFATISSCSHAPTMRQLDSRNFEFYFFRDDVDRPGVDRLTSVKNFLEANALLPPVCPNGVTVLRSGDTQGGWGWARLECK